MRHFLLFLLGLLAAVILLANVGPMILLGVSVWLLYLVFKQFMKADSTLSKVLWVVLGLIILSVGISNSFAVMGIAAAFLLYWIYKNWHKKADVTHTYVEAKEADPFTNFEYEWQELTK